MQQIVQGRPLWILGLKGDKTDSVLQIGIGLFLACNTVDDRLFQTITPVRMQRRVLTGFGYATAPLFRGPWFAAGLLIFRGMPRV